MKYSFRMQIFHSARDVSCQSDPCEVRQLDRLVLNELFQGSSIDVLGECMELSLMDTYSHEPIANKKFISTNQLAVIQLFSDIFVSGRHPMGKFLYEYLKLS